MPSCMTTDFVTRRGASDGRWIDRSQFRECIVGGARSSGGVSSVASNYLNADAHLLSIRLRTVRDALERLHEVCPNISVGRAARSAGILSRLVLNCVVALWSLWQYKRRPNSSNARAARALTFFESAHLLVSLAVVTMKLAPLTLSQTEAFAWSRAAEGGNCVRQLASYSVLSHIPRIKNLVPGLWNHIQAEAAMLGQLVGCPPVLLVFTAIHACLRVVAFGAVELATTALGLAGLHQKLGEVRGVTSGLIPFLGFANQITGIVDQEELRMVAVLRLLFADEDAEFGQCELQAMREFNGFLLQGLCARHGWCRGAVLYLSFKSEDYQRLLVAKEPTSVQTCNGVCRWASSSSLPSGWWFKTAYQRFLLGKLFLKADRVLWPGDSVAAVHPNSRYRWQL